MKGSFKWLLIIGGSCLFLIIATVLIIPHFIDVNKYRPIIEQKITEATGRSFTLGDKIDLSVFPWVGVKLTDLRLGNPAGFGKKDMIYVKNFEVRLKVLPLLSRRIEVKTFVLDSPEIYLEKLKNGDINWSMAEKKQKKEKIKVYKNEKPSSSNKFPIKSLMVNHFSITNGQLIYINQKNKIKKEISDINLKLTHISLVNPIGVVFGARVDGRPLSLDGTLGPIGKNPGKGTIAFNFIVKALKELKIKIKGNLIDPLVTRKINLQVNVSPFSPRKIIAALDQSFPVQTKDPKALDVMSLKTHVKGNQNEIFLSNGEIVLDNSKLIFSASAKEFFKPNLKFNLQLDEIDLDRYLPRHPAKQERSYPAQSNSVTSKKDGAHASANKKIDYGPLRKLVLNGKIKVGKLKIHGAIIKNIKLHILAKNGIITVDPLDLNLYQGNVASKVKLNVQKKYPITNIKLNANGIQAGPLIKDTMSKELIDGTLQTDIVLSMTGDNPAMIKQTLTGQGNLLFTDGSITGIDLANAVRNLKANFGMGEKLKTKPKTDFAELKIPFTAKNGLINISGTSMISPLLRVIATGNINLVKELLDLRIEPKFVATLKGQGDVTKHSGLKIPLLITGKFSSPKVRPDLKAMFVGDGGTINIKGLKQQILGIKKTGHKTIKSDEKDLKKQGKGLLKGFMN